MNVVLGGASKGREAAVNGRQSLRRAGQPQSSGAYTYRYTDIKWQTDPASTNRCQIM